MATHTVNMTNNCGYGVPTLDQIPSITLATGSQTYTNATVQAGAFLNTGYCGPNGGNCTTVDITMNDTLSVVVVDLIPTHVFTVPVGFTYFNGCDGAGVSCLTADCVNAIRDPSENSGMVTCSVAGAGVLVTFCPNLVVTPTTTSSSAPTSSASSTTTSASSPTSNTSSNQSALVGGVVGGVVGALLIALVAAIVCFFRRRRRRRRPQPAEEFHIEEFTAAAPHSVYPSDITSPSAPSTKTDPYSSTTAIVQPSVTSLDPPPVSPSSGGQAGLRPLPSPPRQLSPASPPNDGVGASVDTVSRSPDLDRIIEGLAERFGWTALPSGPDSGTFASERTEPPEYR